MHDHLNDRCHPNIHYTQLHDEIENSCTGYYALVLWRNYEFLSVVSDEFERIQILPPC